MMEHINVICLKWGIKYNSTYVNRLYAGIKRNTTIPFIFHCFTEKPAGINPLIRTHPLPHSGKLKSWWNKVYLFSNDMPIKGPIFFVDLDTLITGNVDKIMTAQGFVVLRDFYAEKARGVSTKDIGSGLMKWDTTDGQPHPEIWNNFIKNPQKVVKQLHPHGDQRWIQRFVPERKYWQDLFPKQVVSFKTHCVKRLPVKAKIVCYHGKPTIPESITKNCKGWRSTPIPPSAWVKDHWYE